MSTAGSPPGGVAEQMLRHLGLVHMGGRIYDPYSGRFLSPDPFVQSPGNPQNYNRYSYVLNTPLSYTDPRPRNIITVASSFMGMPYNGSFLGSVVQTAVNGGNLKDFIIGMTVSAIAGTSMIRGAITGALAGDTSAIVYGRNIWQAMKNGARRPGTTASRTRSIGGGHSIDSVINLLSKTTMRECL